MDIITIPDELNSENALSVQVINYTNSKEISRQQIILNQNTLSFLTEGTKEVIFNNSALSIDTSKFLLMKSGHCLMTEKFSHIKNYRSVLLFFTNEMLLKLLQKRGIDKIDSKEYKSVYAFEYDGFIQGFVKSLMDISLLSKNIQQKLLEVKLEEIMVYLTEIYGTAFLYSFIDKSDDVTQKFIQTIESNQLNKLTLKELAFLCNMSISTFKREFEKQYSESPIKWFQDKRLEHANRLLRHANKIPSEVYFEAGYENLSSFIQAYRSKYGFTPKQHKS
ncbi:AraC family transcriptional regulator [Siphonobacter sp. SORGH_AS_0500]|uniref:helix-turn-helix domain-containing protein n=1 Tax=Siphonobacter sp. SORGH_AS_0500 TaxID=1864824 RepID=UPI000CC5B963|nr:AraC family transcriptional regulator [Siphonobacter sp. SORGH_AS_0500]PKK38241.1 AraC family transcriptional regulator [Siphonobacter sp. SORGH_AS_0500]